jgi:phage/plasmid-like protein (TIGR03299 family)
MFNLDFLKVERTRTGYGQDISSARTVAEALDMGGLNWTVEARSPFIQDALGNFVAVEGKFANVRVEDNRTLGFVGKNYSICQNIEAFDFVNALAEDGEISFDRAGSYNGGRRVWIQARINDNSSILGDAFEKFIIFMNSHDGTGSIRAIITPIRIACSNALGMALKKAERSWAVKHCGNLADRLIEAQNTLLLANSYMTELEEEASRMNSRILTESDVRDILFELYPDGNSERTIRNAEENRNLIKLVMDEKLDLQDMPYSSYRLLNAISDYESHRDPARATATYAERNHERVMSGTFIDKAVRLLAA